MLARLLSTVTGHPVQNLTSTYAISVLNYCNHVLHVSCIVSCTVNLMAADSTSRHACLACALRHSDCSTQKLAREMSMPYSRLDSSALLYTST